MNHSGEGLPLLFDAGHMAFAGGDVMRAIDKHHKRITHVHIKDVRMDVIDGSTGPKRVSSMRWCMAPSQCRAMARSTSAHIVNRLASYGYEGWFVVEAEQDPKSNPPLKMAQDWPQGTDARDGVGWL